MHKRSCSKYISPQGNYTTILQRYSISKYPVPARSSTSQAALGCPKQATSSPQRQTLPYASGDDNTARTQPFVTQFTLEYKGTCTQCSRGGERSRGRICVPWWIAVGIPFDVETL